jgi:integrase
MPLSDPAVRNAKPSDKSYKLVDRDGLYLLVNHVGKYWRYDYRFQSRRKTLAFGVYPITSLADARERLDKARKLIANGSDPAAIKQAEKLREKQLAANTFEAVALEWHQKQSVKWVAKNTARVLSLLQRDIFPSIGSTPISQVTAGDLLSAVQKIEKRGNFETAHRAMQVSGQIFRYAIATGRAQADLSLVLKGALIPVREKHHPSITDPRNIKDLLNAIEGYSGSFVTQSALRLAPLLFVRPGELRHTEWEEIDFDKAEWRIATGKMKMKAVHLVPLCTQISSHSSETARTDRGGQIRFPRYPQLLQTDE